MPDDDPFPPPGSPAALKVTRRPPVPGWMWAAFGLGLVPVGVIICVLLNNSSPQYMGEAGFGGGMAGLVLGVPMLCGLALAARLFSGTGERIMAGIGFAVLCTIALGAVVFAGCMCLLSGSGIGR